MIQVPGMILIGGNARNSGKTTLACAIIEKFRKSHRLIGLKVTSIRPGEEMMHGHHDIQDITAFAIHEEKSPDSGKDTSRMLLAGAGAVYYIEAADHELVPALEAFVKMLPESSLIVCESRSLRKSVIPGAFFMMIRSDAGESGKATEEYLRLADAVVSDATNPENIRKIVENIRIIHQGWRYFDR